jgi:hypothetical protein
MSRAATFADTGAPVFVTNLINFIFITQTPSYLEVNVVPPVGSGYISYTNVTTPSVPSLPLGKIAISSVSGGQTVIVWESPGTLQASTNLNGSWTSLPAAVSPYVIPAMGTQQFFRLSQ